MLCRAETDTPPTLVGRGIVYRYDRPTSFENFLVESKNLIELVNKSRSSYTTTKVKILTTERTPSFVTMSRKF